MSSTEQFLRETYLPAVAKQLYPDSRPLMRMIEAELRERRAADEAWLASLTESERRAELIRRRIERCEQRLRAALDFRRDNDW